MCAGQDKLTVNRVEQSPSAVGNRMRALRFSQKTLTPHWLLLIASNCRTLRSALQRPKMCSRCSLIKFMQIRTAGAKECLSTVSLKLVRWAVTVRLKAELRPVLKDARARQTRHFFECKCSYPAASHGRSRYRARAPPQASRSHTTASAGCAHRVRDRRYSRPAKMVVRLTGFPSGAVRGWGRGDPKLADV